MDNITFPSFIDFKTKYILQKMTEEDKTKSIYNNIGSFYDLNNIHYQLIKNIKNIHLTYLPKINNQTNEIYYDGSYIEENIIINKNTLKQEIDVLYCIIDYNEYFKYVKPIKDKIIINNIYFIFVKGNKNINIYDAMIIYLNKINVNTIKEIYLGIGFFQEEIEKCFYDLKDYFSYKIPIMNFINEDVFILKKKFKLSKNIIIKTNSDIFKGNKFKLILGLSLLFDSININIDGAKVIDSRFPEKIKVDLGESQNKYIVLKIYDFSFLENTKIKDYFDNNSISSIMLYINEEAKYSQSRNNKIKQNIDILLKDKNFIIYSETPMKFLQEYKGPTTKIEKINNNGLLLLERNKRITHLYSNNFNEYLFLFKKFESIKYIDIIFDDLYQPEFSFLIDYNSIIIDFYEKYGKKKIILLRK